MRNYKNPYLSFRPGQLEAIDSIVESIESGEPVVQLDAGVGAGKSLILSVASRALIDGGMEKVTYTTPQKKLVNQLKNDDRLAIPTLLGKANYPCSYLEEATADDCPFPAKARFKFCPSCPYENEKRRFNSASLAATTLDKILFDKTLEPANALIVDESQGLELKLIKQSEISLPNNITDENLIEDLQSWLNDVRSEIENIDSQIDALAEDFIENKEQGIDPSKKDLSAISRLKKEQKKFEYKARKIKYILRIIELGQKYVINKDRIFSTLDGKSQFNALLREYGQIILASGTPCPQMLTNEYNIVSMQNPIPESQRLVFYDPCGKMSSKDREKTIDIMAPRIAELHKQYGGNTLLHCHAFKVAEDLGNALYDYNCRVIIMERDIEKKEEALSRWLKKEDNAILASVGCEEGLDCKGNKYPLNILAVVPFAFRGDAWVLKREDEDRKLPYMQQYGIVSTAIAIQQAVGRTTRAPDDYSHTYILDENFLWFCKRYRQAFKHDFLSSIRVKPRPDHQIMGRATA